MFGPNQVGEVIIGNATTVPVLTSVQSFITSALEGEVQCFSYDGNPVAANVPFKVYQATGGDPLKGLDYEFSDTINPKYIERVTARDYVAETQKTVVFTVGSIPTVTTGEVTYVAEIRLYNDGGTLSPENFAVISGYYVATTADTTTTIATGLALALQRNVTKRGNSEFVVSTLTNTVTVVGKFQNVVAGKIIAKQIEFDAYAKSFSNAFSLTVVSQNLGLITVATTIQPNPGMGTGKHAVNYEWFVKGMKYDPAREVGYPANFDTPYYALAASTYDTINIIYYAPRTSTIVERQYKVLTIFTNPAGASAVAVDILASITTAVDGSITVPASPV
jgi:hypothetical protein